MKFESKILERIREFFSKLVTREVGAYMNPMRDWTLGLSIAVLVLLGGFSYFAFEFYVQFGIPEADVVGEKTAVSYNEKEVRFYAKQYETKEAVFNQLRQDMKPLSSPVQVETLTATTSDTVEKPLAGDEVPQYSI